MSSTSTPSYAVAFYRTQMGREPVRDFLKELEREDRKVIGEDIKVLQFRWPLGMPLVRKIESNLWEVRSKITHKRIARIFFTVGKNEIILLHGFIKKSQKTPQSDLDLGRSRMKSWRDAGEINE